MRLSLAMPMHLPADLTPVAWQWLAVLALGLFSGLALTLMDRIDEHHIIERHRTPLAYMAGIAATASVVLTLELFPLLYSLPFCFCLEWIVKNKIDYPSHVFSLFLLALYFGWRMDLLWLNAPAIALFLALRLVSGGVLRRRLERRGGWFQWYYTSYCEKFVCNVVFAAVLSSLLVLVYSLGVGIACFHLKWRLPGEVGRKKGV